MPASADRRLEAVPPAPVELRIAITLAQRIDTIRQIVSEMLQKFQLVRIERVGLARMDQQDGEDPIGIAKRKCGGRGQAVFFEQLGPRAHPRIGCDILTYLHFAGADREARRALA